MANKNKKPAGLTIVTCVFVVKLEMPTKILKIFVCEVKFRGFFFFENMANTLLQGLSHRREFVHSVSGFREASKNIKIETNFRDRYFHT